MYLRMGQLKILVTSTYMQVYLKLFTYLQIASLFVIVLKFCRSIWRKNIVAKTLLWKSNVRLQVDFANRKIGGGVLGTGRVQVNEYSGVDISIFSMSS